jgi:hypothetical protein
MIVLGPTVAFAFSHAGVFSIQQILRVLILLFLRLLAYDPLVASAIYQS